MNFSQYSGKRPARYKFDRHATFIIDDKGNRTIRFRVNKNGIKFDTNLVVTGDMTADKAKVANWNLDISRGIDPRPNKRKNSKKPSFRYCMDEYLKKKLTDLTNDKNKKQWRSTLETHICPSIGDIPIDEITSSDIIDAIRPLWNTKRAETGRRTLQRTAAVFGWAMAHGYRSTANPATWQGNIEHVLARPSSVKKPKPFESLPYLELPDFYAKLHAIDSVQSLALRFIILTIGSRIGVAKSATWSEIDSDQSIWRVTEDRMKTDKLNTPITEHVDRVLRLAKAFDNGSGFIFPSPQAGKPISDTTINKLLSLSPKHITTHGFRGTFKTWAEETTYGYSNNVIEACQAHKVGNKIEQHYFKGDFMEKRRKLMHEWGQFVESAL